MLKRSRVLTFLLALLLAAAAPAFAGSTQPFDIQPIGTQTASSGGTGINVAGLTELLVYAKCTGSSAPTTLDLYLQSSDDGGTTWYDLPAEVAMLTDGDASETAAVANKRDVFDGVSTCASPVQAVGRYRNFGGYVRARWFITGTSFTFGVKAVGKY
jgi:hypothetical protein